LLQGMLISMSDEYGTADPPESTGVMDYATSVALADFQSLAGLESTGELDRITWKHLVHHFTLHANRRSRFQNS